MIEFLILCIILGILSWYDLVITLKLSEKYGWQGEANPLAKQMAYNKFMMSGAKLGALLIYIIGCVILLQSDLDYIVFRGMYFIMGLYLMVAVSNTLAYKKS